MTAPFAGITLAARIERAECRLVEECARALARSGAPGFVR